MRDQISIKNDLEGLLKDFKWNFKGIVDVDDNLYPIPKIPQVVTGIFESAVQPKIEKFAKFKYKSEVIHGGAREYPNIILRGGKLGNRLIAIDVKTARKGKGILSGRASLGSCAGYFLYPNRKRPGCKLPYGDFSEHWIILFPYIWNPEADSLNMVSDVDLIVQLKWKIASKTNATGDTAAIGSIRDIEKLERGKGIFESEEEFENYWREKGRRYKR